MTIYKEALLDHYRNPRNRGDLENTQIVRRGRNPLCGDEVDIGITIEDGTLTRVRFRGRACSICIASASIMTEAATGKSVVEKLGIIDLMHRWFEKIGRASCREGVCTYVEITVVDVSLKKKKNKQHQ